MIQQAAEKLSQVDVLKGTGFSPYVKFSKTSGALAPEEMGFRFCYPNLVFFSSLFSRVGFAQLTAI